MKIPVPTPPAGGQIRPMEGLRVWHNAQNGFLVAETHYTADPDRRGDWRLRASPKYGGLNSWRWQKEQEINWHAKAGKLVFDNFDLDLHELAVAFEPPLNWPRWILIDPGWTNPTSVVWVAMDIDSEPNELGYLPLHVYREFYERRRGAKDVAWFCHEMSTQANALGIRELEPIEKVIVDPGAKQEHQSAAAPEKVDESASTVFEQLEEAFLDLGWDVPVETGNNHKNEAIVEIVERLAGYWVSAENVPLYDESQKFREATEEEILAGAYVVQPTMFFHPTTRNTVREMQRYTWAQWASSEVRNRRNDPEKPIDKDDHSVTNLIRFTNELRQMRAREGDLPGEQRADLDGFESRFTRRVVLPADEVAKRRHEGLAGRFRARHNGPMDGMHR